MPVKITETSTRVVVTPMERKLLKDFGTFLSGERGPQVCDDFDMLGYVQHYIALVETGKPLSHSIVRKAQCAGHGEDDGQDEELCDECEAAIGTFHERGCSRMGTKGEAAPTGPQRQTETVM